MKRYHLFPFIVIVALLGCTDHAIACTCIAPGPPCEMFWRADAVFLGLVKSITVMPRPSSILDLQAGNLNRQVKVIFEIREAYRGISGSEVMVWTGRGGGDCGFAFNVGSEYLVYANYLAESSDLSTGICTRTRGIDKAEEDLAYARSVATSRVTGGRIFGIVSHMDPSGFRLPDIKEPMSDVKAKLSLGDQQWETFTGSSGEYAFDGMLPGTYEISFETSTPGFYGGELSRKLYLLDVRGCACADFSFRYDGHVTGKVLSYEQTPIAGLTVELIYSQQLSEMFVNPIYGEQTDSTGRFQFTKVPPGKFLLGIHISRDYRGALPYPQVFYPGVKISDQAETIELGGGQDLMLDPLVVPPDIVFVPITGIVTDLDGVPVKGVNVRIKETGKDRNRYIGKPAVTDADGRFVLAAVRGYEYSVYAEGKTTPQDSDEIPILALPGLAPVKLTLHMQR